MKHSDKSMKKNSLETKYCKVFNKNISLISFGTYRFTKTTMHKDVLKNALLNGINIIETSSNYTNGHAEESVGEVINQLFYDSDLTRNDIILISKGGYITQNTPPEYKNTIAIGHNLYHCLEPEFIKTQITQSLNRLGVNKLDGYLLHNPETYLQNQNNASTSRYYEILKKAFCYLETEVTNGRIKYYGISSNTLSLNQDSLHTTSLKELIKLKKNSHLKYFKLLEFPFNLIETNTVLSKNDVFKEAHKHDFDKP